MKQPSLLEHSYGSSNILRFLRQTLSKYIYKVCILNPESETSNLEKILLHLKAVASSLNANL